jgi:hypothetical protein
MVGLEINGIDNAMTNKFSRSDLAKAVFQRLNRSWAHGIIHLF